jgi:outer membrane receptor for ferric coprogen and ferric-rhodotorulic acid
LILGSRYSSFTYDAYFTNLTTGAMTFSNYKVKGKAIPTVACWILPKTTPGI